MRLKPVRLFTSVLAAALFLGARRIYAQRSRTRIPSVEGLHDPGVAAAFERVAALPQMRLLRWYAIERALRRKHVGRAVDLGCGSGNLVVEMAQRAPNLRITGIDLSEELLSIAAGRAQKAGLANQVDFRVGDAARIPFEDASLDLVISTLSLHHWRDPVAVMNEIARVLRPGGAFVIFDLRRDMTMPFYMLMWFVTRVVVPAALMNINEPMGSRNAAYTPDEAAQLAQQSTLLDWRVSSGPLWLSIEGAMPQLQASTYMVEA